MPKRPVHIVASICALLAAACSSSSPASSTGTGGGAVNRPPSDNALLDADCDPMVPTQCGFPFPSSVYLVDDATTPTKKHVHFGKTSLPVYGEHTLHMDPAAYEDVDGFSPGTPILTHFPGATVAGLPTQDTIDASLGDQSPTVLINADTGERVPHFAELDMSWGTADDERAFIIRPVERLKNGARYIVAIRRVQGADGRALPANDVFAALRDGKSHADPSVARRRALYADIFARLQKASVGKADLQIAWDFVTSSRENNTSWLLHMRDDALAKVGDAGPEYTITSSVDNPNPHIRRRLVGQMTVPLYLDKPASGGRLVFGADGLPKQNGTAKFEFLVEIPNSAVTGTPGALLQVGHGLLGHKEEGQDGYLAVLDDQKNFVSFGVDLVGMSSDDQPLLTNTIVGDIGGFRALIDRQHQGLLNSLLAMRMMKGRFWKDPQVQFGGKSAIDPSQCYYRGDSQGGIFGVTYMAISTDVTRGLLGESGMPYSLLLNRSVDFGIFFTIIRTAYKSSMDIQMGLGLVQMVWDRTEPDGYAPYINQDMLAGTPRHQVLLNVAIGDQQVTPLGAHMIARAVGAHDLGPVNRTVWGVPAMAGPFMGSGMQEFGFGLPESPKENVPPTAPPEDDPHDKVRELQVSNDQTDTFLRTGAIQSTCKGPCDPQ